MNVYVTGNACLKFLTGLYSGLVFGGHITSLGALSIVLSAYLITGVEPAPEAIAIAYLMPLIAYCINYYKELEKDALTNPERVMYLSRRVKVYPVLIAAYVILLILLLAASMNIYLISFVLALVVLSALYDRLFKGLTRTVPGFKNVFTSAIWASGTFIVVFYHHLDLSYAIILLVLFIFLRIFINTIFCDLKDMESDKAEGLKTYPVILGKARLLQYLKVLNGLSCLLIIAGIVTGIFPVYAVAFFISLLYAACYLNIAETADVDGIRLMASKVVDLEVLLWPAALYICMGLAI